MTALKETIKQPLKAAVAERPKLSFWQIFNMSFGFLGIQFGFALQNGNASRILQSFGADVEHLSLFWLAAPITGMIVQPIIGHYSDRTWNRLGRRKPYFLAGGILSAIALFFMPNASLLLFLPPVMVGAGVLMIMDASFNVAMEPFRALIGDNLPDSQRSLGFSVQTFLIGTGAVAGSILPWVITQFTGTEQVAAGHVQNNVIYSFYVGGIVLISCLLWTIFKTKEYSPAEYASFHPEEPEETNKGLSVIFKDFSGCLPLCASWAWCSSSRGSRCSPCGFLLHRPSRSMFFMCSQRIQHPPILPKPVIGLR
jgi:maltose/moltooligosaccharide transporter